MAVWDVLRRGLAADPSARFGSLEELAEALSRAVLDKPVRPWRRRIGAALLVGALGAAGVAALSQSWVGAQRQTPTVAIIDRGALHLVVGEQRTVEVPGLVRVAVGDPSVVDVRVVGRSELLVQALASGSTALMTWNQAGERHAWQLQSLPSDVGVPAPGR